MVRVIRTRSVVVAVVALATLATPDPAVARYVLPFAGLVLAVAVVAVEPLRGVYRWTVFGLAAVVAAGAVYTAYPGLPAVGQHRIYRRGRDSATVSAPRSTAGLNCLIWHGLSISLGRPPEFPDDVDADGATAVIADPSVRLLIAGDDSPVADALRADPGTWEPLFACNSAACTVYARR